MVHYLLSDPTGRRAQQMERFIALSNEGVSSADALSHAFEMSFADFERATREYIRRAVYRERIQTLNIAPDDLHRSRAFASSLTRAASPDRLNADDNQTRRPFSSLFIRRVMTKRRWTA
jgi:hypothetical protein